MSLLDLQTKLDYESERSVPKGQPNVLDFQRLSVRYWNSERLDHRQARLFEKLGQWNNVLVARQSGYRWCSKCEDRGYQVSWAGRSVCSCAATGYAEIVPIDRSELGRMFDERLVRAEKKCCACGSEDCLMISTGIHFWFVCDNEVCDTRARELGYDKPDEEWVRLCQESTSQGQ